MLPSSAPFHRPVRASTVVDSPPNGLFKFPGPLLSAGHSGSFSALRVNGVQARRDNFTFEAVLITVAVGQAPEDTDLVVEPFHQTKADLVLRVTV